MLQRQPLEHGVADDLRHLLEHADDLLCIAGFDGYLHTVSPSWTGVLGWSPAELTARPFLSFVHPDDLEATEAEADRLRAGEQVARFQNRYKAKDGSYRALSWTAHGDPGQRKYYCVVRDVTSERRHEEELQRQNNDLRAFAHTVAHDVRGPLRSASGLLGLVERGDLDAKETLRVVRQRLADLDRMTSRLLAFSEAGHAAIDMEELDMQRVCLDVFGALPADLHVDVEDLPPARGDATLVADVLANLIKNAWKHGGREDIRVSVHGRVEAGWATYTVADNGVGFDPQMKEQIWDSMVQGSSRRGHGIGLATVKRIVDRHGGRVFAESRPGEGARFSFTLPAAS